jgi:hypothetical protein
MAKSKKVAPNPALNKPVVGRSDERISNIITALQEASDLIWEDANTYDLTQMGSDIDDMIIKLKEG